MVEFVARSMDFEFLFKLPAEYREPRIAALAAPGLPDGVMVIASSDHPPLVATVEGAVWCPLIGQVLDAQEKG